LSSHNFKNVIYTHFLNEQFLKKCKVKILYEIKKWQTITFLSNVFPFSKLKNWIYFDFLNMLLKGICFKGMDKISSSRILLKKFKMFKNSFLDIEEVVEKVCVAEN
jgi:hypothetical protein